MRIPYTPARVHMPLATASACMSEWTMSLDALACKACGMLHCSSVLASAKGPLCSQPQTQAMQRPALSAKQLPGSQDLGVGQKPCCKEEAHLHLMQVGQAVHGGERQLGAQP